MWNKQEYNVDALWSNYFVRMFPFKDVPWGKEGSGFHIGSIPNEVHTTTPFYCSNIRIKHLGYMTEDFRDQKCEFIFKYNNKGGINKSHIEAIEKKPILKKYTEKYILPKTLLIIECGSLYNLPKTTIDFLLSQKDLRDKLEIIFLVTDCNINLINQIKTMEEQENNISYFIFNFQKETFFNTIKNKNQLLRLFILNNLKTNFEDKDYLMIASGETELSYDRMYHNLLVEKDVILDCSDTKIITLSNKIVPMLYNTNIDLSDNNIIDFFINQKIRVWGSGLYMEPIEFSIK